MKQLQLPAVLFDNRNQIRFRDVCLSKRLLTPPRIISPQRWNLYCEALKLEVGGRSIVLRDIPVEQGEINGVDNKDQLGAGLQSSRIET